MKVDGISLQGEQVFKAKMPVPAQLEVEEIPQDSPPTAQVDEPSPTEPQSDIQNTDDIEDGKGFCACCRKAISRAYRMFD